MKNVKIPFSQILCTCRKGTVQREFEKIDSRKTYGDVVDMYGDVVAT